LVNYLVFYIFTIQLSRLGGCTYQGHTKGPYPEWVAGILAGGLYLITAFRQSLIPPLRSHPPSTILHHPAWPGIVAHHLPVKAFQAPKKQLVFG
jgi:hypothetical protein